MEMIRLLQGLFDCLGLICACWVLHALPRRGSRPGFCTGCHGCGQLGPRPVSRAGPCLGHLTLCLRDGPGTGGGSGSQAGGQETRLEGRGSDRKGSRPGGPTQWPESSTALFRPGSPGFPFIVCTSQSWGFFITCHQKHSN